MESKLNDDESLANNYQIVPQFPLACDFYGLLIPKEDPQWNDLVNEFIIVQTGKNLTFYEIFSNIK